MKVNTSVANIKKLDIIAANLIKKSTITANIFAAKDLKVKTIAVNVMKENTENTFTIHKTIVVYIGALMIGVH